MQHFVLWVHCWTVRVSVHRGREPVCGDGASAFFAKQSEKHLLCVVVNSTGSIEQLRQRGREASKLECRGRSRRLINLVSRCFSLSE